MCDKLVHLAKHTFQQNYIGGEPLIHQGRRISNNEVRHWRVEKETRYDILIWGIWERQTDTVIVIRFRDADCDSYNKYPMRSLLSW